MLFFLLERKEKFFSLTTGLREMIFEKISLLIRVLWPIDKKKIFVHFLVLIKKKKWP